MKRLTVKLPKFGPWKYTMEEEYLEHLHAVACPVGTGVRLCQPGSKVELFSLKTDRRDMTNEQIGEFVVNFLNRGFEEKLTLTSR